MPQLDRRGFLKMAGALAGAASWDVSGMRRGAAAQEDDPSLLDVAIVGGGVAGAYCAWRLAQPDTAVSPILGAIRGSARPRIALFEISERIGGRLWSYVPPGMPHVRAELGGMRIPTDQKLVLALVDHLGIATIPFPMGDEHNLRYLRGRRFTVADLDDPAIVPYDLPPPYRGKTPDDITIETIERYVPNAGRLSEAEWSDARQSASYDGVPLSDLGFRYLIERELPGEAFNFIREEAGFEDFTVSSNAVDAMYDMAIGFDAPPPVVTPLLGMDEIPRSLAAGARSNGAAVYREHRVRRISAVPGSGPGEPGLRLEVEVGASGEQRAFTAHHVILAMPPRAISLFAADSLPLTAPAYPALAAAVIPLAASKIFLGFARPWWRDLGITSGRTISDLPLKVTYYMATEGERPGADPANQRSLLMPSYAEGSAVDFWASFRLQDPDTPGGAHFQRPEIGVVPEALTVSERAVAELQRELRLVHGPEVAIGDPTMAVMADWRRDPFGGGYHVWAAGATAWEMIPVAREPVPGVNLSICGEAWSSVQGWTRGALMTAEQTLQKRLGLPWPEWLPGDVDLGP